MRIIHILVFIALFSFTYTLYSQPYTSQEAINAVVNTRIGQLERDTATNTDNLERLAREVSSLRSSLDQFTGIGVGIGCTLTVLQGLLVIITYKRNK